MDAPALPKLPLRSASNADLARRAIEFKPQHRCVDRRPGNEYVSPGDWYTLGGVRLTAWDMLDYGRYLLLAAAIIGLVLLIVVATQRSAQTSFLAAARTAAVGFACTVYIVYRLLKRPDALDADTGLFIGLASALLVTIGGLISTRDQTAGPAHELKTDSAPEATDAPAAPGTASR